MFRLNAKNLFASMFAERMPDTCWVFIHLPKCAGTSIVNSIKKRYKKTPNGFYEYDFRTPEASLDQICNTRFHFICGHIGGAEVDQLRSAWPSVRFRTFTFLRDPKERLLSAYRHSRMAWGDIPPLSSITQSSPNNLSSSLWNTQTRQLARCYDFERSGDTSREAELLEAAKRQLDQCEFVGQFENLHKDAREIHKLVGVSSRKELKRLKATKHLEVEPDELETETVSKLIYLDMKIHEYARLQRGDQVRSDL